MQAKIKRVHIAFWLFIASALLVYGFLYALHNNKAGLVWWLLVGVVFVSVASFVLSLYFARQVELLEHERDDLARQVELLEHERDDLAHRLNSMIWLRIPEGLDREIVMFYCLGLTFPQIANILPLSESRVASRLSELRGDYPFIPKKQGKNE